MTGRRTHGQVTNYLMFGIFRGMNLKEKREWYMGKFGDKKGKEKLM